MAEQDEPSLAKDFMDRMADQGKARNLPENPAQQAKLPPHRMDSIADLGKVKDGESKPQIPRPDITNEADTIEWVLTYIGEPFSAHSEALTSSDPDTARKLLIKSQAELITRGTRARNLPIGTERDSIVDGMMKIAESQQKEGDWLSPSERDKVEGVKLAAITASHEINNDLVEATGVMDLLIDQGLIPPQMQEMADSAAARLQQASGKLTSMARVRRIVTINSPMGPRLDLDASSAPQNPSTKKP